MTLVVCRALGKRYGRTQALDSVDLVLEAGPPIALVGPNGAGKTTLLSLLSGFIRPSSGEVTIAGLSPRSSALAGRRAALPQDALFDPRIDMGRQLRLLAELQGYRRKEARAEVARVLDVVGLSASADKLPTALSHGMRKRMALAQALLGEPELVLLDEPTAGIDPENARAIRELIVSRTEGTTFVVSSHNLDELERLCGSVVQLEQGRLMRQEALSSIGMASRGRRDETREATGLTLRLPDNPAANFEAAVSGLPGVLSLRRLSDGAWHISVAEETAVAIALLELLERENWVWRQLSRGQSLEERLYG